MKEIKLTQGKVVLIDDEDYEMVSQFKWRYLSGYAVYSDNSKVIRMHRLIMKCPVNMQIDHIDGNGLNNMRNNLRICTKTQNSRNTKKTHKNCSSKYKGVYFINGYNYWRAQLEICLNNKRKHISAGIYKTEIEAAVAYNEIAKKMFGEYAKLNVIEKCGW